MSSFRSTFKFIQAIAIVTGTIVGAGVMGLPYAFMQVGVWWGSLVVLVVGVTMTTLLLMLGYVALRSTKRQQLTGYAERYLGTPGKHVLAVAMMLNVFGAMLAYTIGQGTILADLFGGRADMWSYGFFLLLGLLVVMGINVIKYVESFFTILILGLFVVLLVFAAPEFAWTNVPVGTINTSNLLMIYGVALTACFGLTAVPQVRNILRTEKPTLTYAAILVGGLVPAGLYILFSILTLGVTGTETSPVAIVSLTDRLGFVGLAVGSLFAVLAMTTSFLALGLALRNVLHHDYGFSKFIAFSITLGVPLSLFIFGIRDFVGVLSVIGGVALNIVGIISILLFWRANQGEFTHRWQRMVVSFFSVLMFCMFVVSLVLVLGGEG